MTCQLRDLIGPVRDVIRGLDPSLAVPEVRASTVLSRTASERRTQEIGRRIAPGALQEDVVGLTVRKGTFMMAVGLVGGLVAALPLSGLLRSQLYGVAPTDPLTFAAVAVGFGLAALVATWLPSRRAARIDPIRALKAE